MKSRLKKKKRPELSKYMTVCSAGVLRYKGDPVIGFLPVRAPSGNIHFLTKVLFDDREGTTKAKE